MVGRRLFTWDEMDSAPSVADGIMGMVQGARAAYCDVRRRIPWAFDGIFPDSPLSQANRALGDRICPTPQPGTPEPTIPTWRGNCPVQYRVNYTWRLPNVPGTPPVSTGDIFVQGPVVGAIQRRATDGSVQWGILGADNGFNGGFYQVVQVGVASAQAGPFSAQINSVTPTGPIPPGGCELQAPPRQYENPSTPTPEDYRGPEMPFSPVPGPGRPTGRPIVFPPVIPLPVPIPVPTVIAPQVFIPVRVGPIDFNFDLGGVNLQFNGTVNLNFGQNQPYLPPGPPDSGRPPVYLPPGDSQDCPATDLTPVITAVNTARSDILNNNNAQTLTLRPRRAGLSFGFPTAAASSGAINLDPNIAWVQVTMQNSPRNRGAQYGGGNAPDVTYAGWYSFGGSATEGGDRHPLDYDVTRVQVPPGATTFTFTCKDGRSATVRLGTLNPGISGTWRRGTELMWSVE
jgi:hypothetical protein